MNYSDILRFRIAEMKDKEYTIYDLTYRDKSMTDAEHDDFVKGAKSSIGKLVDKKEIEIVRKIRHSRGYLFNIMKTAKVKPIRNKEEFKFKKARKELYSVWQEVYPELFTVPAYLLKFTKKRIHSVPY